MGFSDRGHVESKTSSMKRELSVEDLFAPLNRLDVRPQSSAVANSHPTSLDISSSSPSVGLSTGCLPLSETTPTSQGGRVALAVAFRSILSRQGENRHATLQSQSSDRRLNQSSSGEVQDLGNCASASQDLGNRASASLPNPFGPVKRPTSPFSLVGPAVSGIQAAGVDPGGVNESGNSIVPSFDLVKPSMDMPTILEEARGGLNAVNKSREAERSRSLSRKGSGGSKSPASGSDTGLQTQGNSTSDEDQQVLDDRKQRRMLSNRESARRSRLRKQQHLDELRAHVALLRAENSQMLSRFNLTSQHYAQITEENRLLRSEAIDLSHKLQRLHHTVAAQYPNGFRYGVDLGQVAQGMLREESSHLKPLS